MRAVLSIGSNLADSRALLRGVRAEFAEELIAVSSIYRTPAWGVTDQPDFFNAVLIVEVDQSPHELLRRGQRLEQEANRVREYRWGPRTLDVDIVALSEGTEMLIDAPDLTVPHPHAHERAFVLVPWLEADPQARLRGEPVEKLLEALHQEDVEAIVKDERL